MNGAPDPIRLRRSGRLPVIGLAVIIALLSVFASIMAVFGKRATDLVAQSTRSHTNVQRATDGLRDQMLLTQQYLTQPTSGVKHRLQRNGAEIDAILSALTEDGVDTATVTLLSVGHHRFDDSLGQFIAAVDSGDVDRAELLENEQLKPVASGLLYCAEQILDRQHRVTDDRLQTLSRLQAIGMATPIVFGCGLILIVIFWRMMRSYQRRSYQQALDSEYQALHDALTGLGNRELLMRRIEELTDGPAVPDRQAALILMDLNRFKEVNDTLGHHCGDRLLQQLAQRLSSQTRDGDCLVRLGGDEYAMLLPATDVTTAEAIGARLLATLTEPLTVDGITLSLEGSLGIAIHPDHADTPADLLRRADIAMYTAKENHRGLVVYDDGLDKRDTRRLHLIGELRSAVGRHELVLHYQPKARLADGVVTGVEALVRWQHPELGLLGPYEFIPIAEQTGLITDVTAHVLDQALSQTRDWLDAGIHLTMSVNVPTRCLLNSGFVDEVAASLEAHAVPAGQLTLEITEGTIMQDPVQSLRVLHRLRAMGVILSIDDFGTGYSSMTYLKNLPVHELKVDRSFVSQMSADSSDRMIVASTIDLGHNLGLQVVAEGVEDQDTWDRLRELGCDSVQGYLLSKPVPPHALGTWLSERTPPAAHVGR